LIGDCTTPGKKKTCHPKGREESLLFNETCQYDPVSPGCTYRTDADAAPAAAVARTFYIRLKASKIDMTVICGRC
jgi:hypothetical protein